MPPTELAALSPRQGVAESFLLFRRVTLIWGLRRLQRGPTPGGVRSRLG
jgi:hypothetical protein